MPMINQLLFAVRKLQGRCILKKLKEYNRYFKKATYYSSYINELLTNIKELDTEAKNAGTPKKRVDSCRKKIEELTKSLAKYIRKFCCMSGIIRECLEELNVIKEICNVPTNVGQTPKLQRLSINIGPQTGIDSILLDKLLKKPAKFSVFGNKLRDLDIWFGSKTANAQSLKDGIKSTDNVVFEIQ